MAVPRAQQAGAQQAAGQQAAPPAGGQQGAPQATAPAAPRAIVPVAASSVANNPDAYIGENVAMTATVEQSLSKTAFSVDQDKTKATGKDVLVLAPRLNEPVELNTYVTVIGQLMKFDRDEIAKQSKDYPLDLPADAVARFQGQPVVLATSVINNASIDLARRLPPPMTAEEEAFSRIMKQVQPAFGAMRKGVDAKDSGVAAPNVATLRQAFTQVEAFFKTKRIAEAMTWAGDARKLAEGIEKATAEARWDEASASAGNLQKACATCHGTYRERYDDGSFRMKLGGNR
jgi:cytochrome c556